MPNATAWVVGTLEKDRNHRTEAASVPRVTDAHDLEMRSSQLARRSRARTIKRVRNATQREPDRRPLGELRQTDKAERRARLSEAETGDRFDKPLIRRQSSDISGASEREPDEPAGSAVDHGFVRVRVEALAGQSDFSVGRENNSCRAAEASINVMRSPDQASPTAIGQAPEFQKRRGGVATRCPSRNQILRPLSSYNSHRGNPYAC